MEKIKFLSTNNNEGTLFLQGVFKKDCKQIEDIFQDRLMSDSITKKTNTVIYNKIPSVFTDVDKWPKKTNLLCNWCTRKFDTFPWFEPQSIEPVSIGDVGIVLSPSKLIRNNLQKGFSIITKGIFCSVNCVSAFIHKNYRNLSDKHNKLEMLKFLYLLVTGNSVCEILPSPEFTEMLQYGGQLSRIEYQKKIDDLQNEPN